MQVQHGVFGRLRGALRCVRGGHVQGRIRERGVLAVRGELDLSERERLSGELSVPLQEQ